VRLTCLSVLLECPQSVHGTSVGPRCILGTRSGRWAGPEVSRPIARGRTFACFHQGITLLRVGVVTFFRRRFSHDCQPYGVGALGRVGAVPRPKGPERGRSPLIDTHDIVYLYRFIGHIDLGWSTLFLAVLIHALQDFHGNRCWKRSRTEIYSTRTDVKAKTAKNNRTRFYGVRKDNGDFPMLR
jgi:hypothetical protein